jgi:cyclopropane fatty-acyl-phospholipid synthase-like methyltransferase
MKRDFQIRFLKQMSLEPRHYLVDIGCGTLRGGIPLIEYLQEGHYHGIEVRENVLEEGRKELREANLEHKRPKLVVAPELSCLNLEREFDFVWAFSVLIHMSDEVLMACLEFVRKHLKTTGCFYANVNMYRQRQDGAWQGFPIVWRGREFYEQAARRSGLHVVDLGSLRSFGHVSGVQSQDEQRMLKCCKG